MTLSIILSVSFGLVLLGIQSTPAVHWLFGDATPDLLTIVVVHLGLGKDIQEGAISLVILGFFADVFSGAPIGVLLVTSVLVFLLLQLLRARLAIGGVGAEVLFSGVGAFLASILLWVIASIFIQSFEGGAGLLRFAFGRAVTTAALAWPVAWVLRFMDLLGPDTRGRSNTIFIP